MKKKLLLISAIILAIGVLGILIFFNYVGDEKFTEGIYKVQDCEAYPEAYIEVKDDHIQFYNIDLNALYHDADMEDYNKVVSMGGIEKLSDEDLARVSDYNRAFVDNPWKMEYNKDKKNGTFVYVNFCMIERSMFGIVVHYDAFDKSIKVFHSGESYTFKK